MQTTEIKATSYISLVAEVAKHDKPEVMNIQYIVVIYIFLMCLTFFLSLR
jgi:hypothetical protein